MITVHRRLIAMVMATFAVAVPATAQSAGSYQKEPMFPRPCIGRACVSSPSQSLECGNGSHRVRVSAND
jgi:hypothetical protein